MEKASKVSFREGVWLEDSSELLPWDASIEQLKRIGNPNAYGRTLVRWSGRKCFDGLSCSLEASFDSIPDKYSVNTTKLRHVTISFDSLEHESQFQLYERVLKKLILLFGNPKDFTHESWNQMKLPFVEWDMDDVLLVHMVFERFGPIAVTELWHQPIPDWRIK